MRARSRLGVALILVLSLSVGSCCTLSRTIGVFTHDEQPVWKTDLREEGFTGHFGGPGKYEACRQIAFGSDDELVVLNDSGAIRPPNPVRAFILETSTGRLVDRAEWVSGGWPHVYATAAGGYAVVTGEGTAIYSPALKGIVATSPVYVNHASPDGRALSGWLQPVVPGHAVTAILDTVTLKPTGIEVVNANVESISDDRVSLTAYRDSPYMSVFTDGAAHELIYQTHCKEVRAHFLSNQVLAVDGCNHIEVVTLEGKLLFDLDVSHDTGFAAVSRDGRRFATLESCYSPGDAPHLCAERVRVADLERKDTIFSVTLRDMPRRETAGDSGVALSPDGTLLAVNTLGVVRLYRLP